MACPPAIFTGQLIICITKRDTFLNFRNYISMKLISQRKDHFFLLFKFGIPLLLFLYFAHLRFTSNVFGIVNLSLKINEVTSHSENLTIHRFLHGRFTINATNNSKPSSVRNPGKPNISLDVKNQNNSLPRPNLHILDEILNINRTSYSVPIFRHIISNEAFKVKPGECSSCAVVFSSGYLREAKAGVAIDAHHCILRFNDAPVKGHVSRGFRSIDISVLYSFC